jgi:hypothetical protein
MRTDSIYTRLEQADRRNDTRRVAELMIFLGETQGDRFGRASELVKGWGVKTSKTALAEGYDAFVSLWRLRQASRVAQSTEKMSTFDAEAARMIGQQTFITLSKADLDPGILVAFAKIELEKERLKIDQRRMTLLESRQAKAKETLGDGKLTTEEKVRRINQIFGKPE